MLDRRDNYDTQSLRGFLRMVQERHPEEFLRVRDPVDLRLDMTSVVFELERQGRDPVVYFEKSTATNARRHQRRGEPQAPGRLSRRAPGDLPRRSANAAEIHSLRNVAGRMERIVVEGDDVDLTELPIPLQLPSTARRTSPPGRFPPAIPHRRRHTGFHRLMLKGKNRLGVSLHSRRRMYEFHRRAEEGPVAAGRHHDRDASAALHGLDGLRLSAERAEIRDHRRAVRRAVPLAHCGIGDLEVPAGAEIVIEGEILAGVHEPEGPFGEFTGYASYRSTQNVFVAKLRMRPDAMYHGVTSGMSKDHILVSCITREGEILNALRRNLPNVRAVHVPHTTCGAFMAFVSMGRPPKASRRWR